MDSVDWAAALEGVTPAEILLPLLFITAPGIAACKGLSRFRKGKPQPAQRQKPGVPGPPVLTKRKRGWGQIVASALTALALLGAGYGLVPLLGVAYKVIAGYKYGPAVAGLIVLVLLLAKGIAMFRDLSDGKMNHPWLWLGPVPLAVLFVWAFPVMWDQATDQAALATRVVIGGIKDAGSGDKPTAKKTPKPEKSEAGGGTSGDE